MSEEPGTASRPTDPVGRVLYKISRILAILGGVLLFAIAMMMSVSITGRFFFSAPVPGDFELVAIGTGVAVFAFLPWCQLTRGNVIVDFFMANASVRAKAFFDTLGGFMYLAIGVLLTWRMVYGGIDMYNYGERSMTINFPRWTTFPISILFMSFLCIVVVYTVGRSIAETRTNKMIDQ